MFADSSVKFDDVVVQVAATLSEIRLDIPEVGIKFAISFSECKVDSNFVGNPTLYPLSFTFDVTATEDAFVDIIELDIGTSQNGLPSFVSEFRAYWLGLEETEGFFGISGEVLELLVDSTCRFGKDSVVDE